MEGGNAGGEVQGLRGGGRDVYVKWNSSSFTGLLLYGTLDKISRLAWFRGVEVKS